MDSQSSGGVSPQARKPATWSRFKYPQSLIRYGIYLFVVIFIGYSLHYLNIPIERFYLLLGSVWGSIFSRYYPPDLAYALDKGYLRYVFETVQMAYVGTLLGVVISIPIAWCASFNVTPSRRVAYPIARFIIMASRSIHEMIWAILFVIILGYGMLPGVLALTLFTIGFAGKLFSEEAESIKMGQVEAIRATGGNSLQVMVYAVMPQVKVAWAGISIYAWDSAFRAATVLGYFGAGGMGWYLKQTIETLENLKVSAILLSIISLVIVSEIASAWVRKKISGK
jgi:phosphonate transport system permease protein